MYQNYIYFVVKDTGIGIKKENFTRIFNMFEKIQESKDTKVGWGIGLSIVKGLVERMNGTIGVESEYGVGSIFWFEIPYESTNDSKISLVDSLPVSNYKTIIFVIQDEVISDEFKNLLNGMKIEDVIVTKSKKKMSNIFQSTENVKLFVDDELIYQIPPNIPHKHVVIIGNSSKKDSEYNDCLRLFKPLLPSHLIAQLTPTLNKKFSGDENLLIGAKILIVEDHIVIQKCIKKFVEKMSPEEILVASNGKEALNLFEKQPNVDIILTDLNMPVMDGYELIQSIKNQQESRPKIIVMTGELNNQTLVDFISQWKVEDILLKPISYKSLASSIRNSFDN